MAWFYCFVEGENFLLKPDENEEKLFGFYANRHAKAKNADEAEQKVLSALKQEYEILRPAQKQTINPAKVYFNEILELTEKPKKIMRKGATWFPMDGDE